MVTLVNKQLDGITLYIDDYLEDDKIMRGRNTYGTQFIIVNNKTMDIILTTIKKNERIKKLNNILGIDKNIEDKEFIKKIKE